MPSAVNFATHAPGLSAAVKTAAGIHPERSFPPYARQTFRSWFERRGPKAGSRERVILFPDTFNNFFRPGVGVAAVEVLEALGYEVAIPKRLLCCGRPLYDEGMLTTAKRLLQQIMKTLDSEVSDGTWVVGLEPACVATFRDELINLFPDDERAQRLSRQTLFLTEFLAKHEIEVPQLERKATVHMHCNHHAVLNTQAERAILKRLGLDFELLNSGCCGMAGSFGFEKEHYDVAMKCGERVLLPAVREADEDALIIANGFSCREQIAQATDRQALHLAQVMRMALRERAEPGSTGGARPERRHLDAGGLQG